MIKQALVLCAFALVLVARAEPQPGDAAEAPGAAAAAPGEIPCFCTFNYSPVCGGDGRTYPNECALGCENSKLKSEQHVALAHNGACE